MKAPLLKLILLSISISLTPAIIPSTTPLENPYSPINPVKSFLNGDKALLNLTQPEKLARTLNTIPEQVKQALRIATYTINFRRVGMKCYYDNCVEGMKFKKDLENELKGGRMIGNVYFVVSFGLDGNVKKEAESFWGSVFRRYDVCKGCENLKESVEKLPMFYINGVKDQKPYPHGLGLVFSTNPQQLPPNPKPLTSIPKPQLIINAILDELTDFSTIVPLKLDIFSELLVSGLGKSLQTFVDVQIENRITLYYDDLCKQPQTPQRQEAESAYADILPVIAIISVSLVIIDVLVLIGKAVLRRKGRSTKGREALRDGEEGSQVRVGMESDS